MSREQEISRMRDEARKIFQAGIARAEPQATVREAITTGPGGRPVIALEEIAAGSKLRVVAFGKAACTMAEAASSKLDSEVVSGPGIVVVNRENYRDLEGFHVYASGHPMPDAQGIAASKEMIRYVENGRQGDGLLVLISGGGSALLPAPADDISLEDKMETTRLLLACGATIHELNTVRKHLSKLKGGGLARRASPARVESLILSDVIGDDLSTIASGPTVADPTTFADARGILENYGILEEAPAAVREWFKRGCRGEVPDTPKPGGTAFEDVRNVLIGSNRQSLDATADKAAEIGFQVVIASTELAGEARDAGVRLARSIRKKTPGSPPLAILAGGETTVTLRGNGKGGRSQEMALSFALACGEMELPFPWVFLSGGTDGRDGPTDAAGAVVDRGTISRGEDAGRSIETDLEDNNSYAFLKSSGDLLMTGATGTNVADLQIVLVR